MGSRSVSSASALPLAGDVARRLLRQRLQDVARAADAVSGGKPTGTAIHRLRVCTRRASAAFTAFRSLVPEGRRRWFQRSLRRVRRAVSETRDLDVIIARCRPADTGHRTLPAGGTTRRRLAELLARRRSLTERDVSGLMACDWEARLTDLLAAMRNGRTTETMASFTRRRSRRLIRRFLDRCERRRHGGRAIHRLRIETKKLRYALEALTAGTPGADDPPAERELRRLQDRLGEFTDRAAAADRLDRWSRHERDRRCRELLADARRHEASAARRAREAWIRWWSASRRDRLARRLRLSLRGRTA